MHPIDELLSRSCATWSMDDHAAAFRELVTLVDALSEEDAARWIPEIDARLARAYGTPSHDGVYFEDDQRVAPTHWVFPTPRPALVLARDLSVDLGPFKIDEATLLEAARSPYTRAINYLRIEYGRLDQMLAELLATPLFDRLELLVIRGAEIGGDAGAALIAATPALATLGVLELSFSNVHEEGVEAILASPHLRGLERLTLDANSLDPYGELGQPYWDELNAKLDARRIEMVFV